MRARARLPKIAGDAWLRHFKDGAPDAIAISDAHLAIGRPVDGRLAPVTNAVLPPTFMGLSYEWPTEPVLLI